MKLMVQKLTKPIKLIIHWYVMIPSLIINGIINFIAFVVSPFPEPVKVWLGLGFALLCWSPILIMATVSLMIVASAFATAVPCCSALVLAFLLISSSNNRCYKKEDDNSLDYH